MVQRPQLSAIDVFSFLFLGGRREGGEHFSTKVNRARENLARKGKELISEVLAGEHEKSSQSLMWNF